MIDLPREDKKATTQGALFDWRADDPAVSHQTFHTPVAMTLAELTYRQADYWARNGFILSSARAAEGSGSRRLYTFEDITRLALARRLSSEKEGGWGFMLPRVREMMSPIIAQNRQIHLANLVLLSKIGAKSPELILCDELSPEFAGSGLPVFSAEDILQIAERAVRLSTGERENSPLEIAQARRVKSLAGGKKSASNTEMQTSQTPPPSEKPKPRRIRLEQYAEVAAKRNAAEVAAREISRLLGFEIHPNDDPKLRGDRQKLIEARGQLMQKIDAFCHQIGIKNSKEIQALNLALAAEEERAKITKTTRICADRLDEMLKMFRDLLEKDSES